VNQLYETYVYQFDVALVLKLILVFVTHCLLAAVGENSADFAGISLLP
jgi:hypothetical protein